MKPASLVAPLLLVLGCGHVGCARAEMNDLDGSVQPVRKRFNAEKDRSRVVAIFSPV